MATREQLIQAGIAADKAGNTEDARAIADLIRAMPAEGAAPAAQPAPAAAPQDDSSVLGRVGRRMVGMEGNADGSSTPLQEIGGQLNAALTSALDWGTFGMSRKAAAFLDSQLGSDTYSTALAKREQAASQLADEHPLANVAGAAAGLVGGGGVLGGGARVAAKGLGMVAPEAGAMATRAITALTPSTEVGKVGNAVRIAGSGAIGGGVVGAAQSATSGKPNDVTGLLTDTAVGALAGGVGGLAAAGALRGADKALRGMAGFVSETARDNNAWRFLANKLKTDPVTLQQALQNYSQHTGQKASIAQGLQMRDQDVLADMARANPRLGERVMQAQQAGETALPGQMAQRLDDIAGPIQTTAGLQKHLDDQFGAFMEPRRGMPVQMTHADADILDNGMVRDILRRNDTTRAKMTEATGILNPSVVPDGVSNVRYRGFSIDDMDNLRKDLRDIQMNGTKTEQSQAKVLADRVAALTERSHKGYADTLKDYETGMQHIGGMTDAIARKPNVDAAGGVMRAGPELEGFASGNVSALNQGIRGGPQKAMRSAEELEGSLNLQEAWNSANGAQQTDAVTGAMGQFAKGQRALDRIAPASVPVEQAGMGIHEIAHGAAALGAGTMPGKAHHIGRMIKSLRMSEATQNRVADMLLDTDPQRVAKGIANLKRAGATEQQIRAITQGVAALGGANTVEAMQ